jgi:putative phosphoribosyl transferase
MPPTLKAGEASVWIPVRGVSLGGELTLPEDPAGLVLFAHGSGSSRFSPRNRKVAHELQQAGLGTLLFDLLTESESHSQANIFALDLLADRLLAATEWLVLQPETASLPLGYFGASTGAGAALIAAARAGDRVHAVVSRGGRPDLAGDWLSRVRAPTLLIVGSLDTVVVRLNRLALRHLQCPARMVEVPGATHLFEESGTLEQVSHLACDWFLGHLGSGAGQSG